MHSDAIVGVVVVYFPEIENLVRNINKYLNDIDHLIIWENSSLSEQDNDYIKNNLISTNYSIIVADHNCGLGKPYNYALEYAYEHKYTFLLTMDQDSEWYSFGDYYRYIVNNNNQNNSIGIFGPRIVSDEACTIFQDDSNNIHFKIVDHVISSGALYKVSTMKRIGGFNEKYFIDAIDEEICLRAAKYNIKTAIVPYGQLHQQFGNRAEVAIGKKKTLTSNYSAFRYYYIVRNHIWLSRCDYVDKSKKKLILHNYVWSPIVKVILFEDNKFPKIKSIIRGALDGLRGDRIDG